MHILMGHNFYRQPGGEDTVIAAEHKLLNDHGHQVTLCSISNQNINGMASQIFNALNTSYSWAARRLLTRELNNLHPSCVHFHNIFPQLTPSVYDSCCVAGVPVIQTLHNYRNICPGALLMRDGKICETCVTASPYSSVLHRCYRNSRLGTLAVANSVAFHRWRKTWGTKVDRFIALTQFAKNKFVEAGFPEDRIAVKPNFYDGTGVPLGNDFPSRNGALFVGRLSEEKGISTLLDAWHGLEVPLRVAGEGPLSGDIERIDSRRRVSCLGRLDPSSISEEMRKASFLVMPSVWYEGFPMVLVEAFAHALPVIASDIGGMAEIVEDGHTGLHFRAGDAEDLVAKVQWMHDHPEECRQMGYNARRAFEEKFTAERNYEMLVQIYQEAINRKKSNVC